MLPAGTDPIHARKNSRPRHRESTNGNSAPRNVEGARLFRGSESAQPTKDPTAETAGVLLGQDAIEEDRGVDEIETPKEVTQGVTDVEKTFADMMARLRRISVATQAHP